MPFQVSPGINVSEIDLSTVVPAVSTTEGALAGVFNWGPIEQRVLVTSENELVSRFGRPTDNNAETFFAAADFLAYGNKLYIARTASSDAYNAGAANTQVATTDEALAITGGEEIIARYPGSLGNSLKISVCPSANAFNETANGVTIATGANTGTVTDYTKLTVGDKIRIGVPATGYQVLQVSAIDGANVSFTTNYTLSANATSLAVTRLWANYNNVAKEPGANNVHIVIIDEDGVVSGTAGTVLEVYENVSVVATAKKDDGSTNYYKTIINNTSNYVYATGATYAVGGSVSYVSLANGSDGSTESTVSLGDLAKGYDLFSSAEDVDVSVILAGKARHGTANTGVANYIIDNICSVRRDCVVFISPERETVVANPGNETADLVTFRNAISSSSYAVIDSGYKYRYDKYNDVYRYTPLNGDIAGLTVRTDEVRDPWWSPAGYVRGNIKNVIRLAFNPNKANRDILYANDINPVITQPGHGCLLLGDKTALGYPSAFDRINVRRLFIALEKAIAVASKTTLFEFNDSFTRAQFRNLIEPFLRDVKARRGIYDFRVVCDDTNNTAEVIDRNEFRGDIYIKPAKSINFIQLNFIAARTGVAFEEIVGQF